MKLTPEQDYARAKYVVDSAVNWHEEFSSLREITRTSSLVTEAQISFINILDFATQWTVAAHGIDVSQMDKEESVCQYTVFEDESFEVVSLSNDERFKNAFYVQEFPHLEYYFGVPIKASNGLHVGALCVMHDNRLHLTDEQKQVLKNFAKIISNQFALLENLKAKEEKFQRLAKNQARLMHDVRAPLASFSILAEMYADTDTEYPISDYQQGMRAIQTSAQKLSEFADYFLKEQQEEVELLLTERPSLASVRTVLESLRDLYQVQAQAREVKLAITFPEKELLLAYPKPKLLHIIGNIISNAIKFTPKGKAVYVLAEPNEQEGSVQITVKDEGPGLSEEEIAAIQSKAGISMGSFGLGLKLSYELLEELGAKVSIENRAEGGLRFAVKLKAQFAAS
ncbi:GAF sensor signal transduction histidine kinase [Nitritalea halalkaliphila LW7]|uniref:histidine kinase n=1 Tax=Nitritalea halalkaliphila LW7 TaxID=1189621 RepID=I5CAP4_9BACT|nr:GAF domain-containing sensor histidine kinase [Nitritalea halalkaliphila]EIM78896.1 GAF sensor signal transduction histidine kinase [Nitritalea halalkaliphila LW7]